jgi:hypothetical protein
MKKDFEINKDKMERFTNNHSFQEVTDYTIAFILESEYELFRSLDEHLASRGVICIPIYDDYSKLQKLSCPPKLIYYSPSVDPLIIRYYCKFNCELEAIRSFNESTGTISNSVALSPINLKRYLFLYISVAVSILIILYVGCSNNNNIFVGNGQIRDKNKFIAKYEQFFLPVKLKPKNDIAYIENNTVVILEAQNKFKALKKVFSQKPYNSDFIQQLISGDFNGDGKDDIAAFCDCGENKTRIDVWISQGDNFTYQDWWLSDNYNGLSITGRVTSGDFNGDGKDDIAGLYDYGQAETRIHVWLSAGNSFVYTGDKGWLSSKGYDCLLVKNGITSKDMDQDGKMDLVAFCRPEQTQNGVAADDKKFTKIRMHIWFSTGTSFSEYTEYFVTSEESNLNVEDQQYRNFVGKGIPEDSKSLGLEKIFDFTIDYNLNLIALLDNKIVNLKLVRR